MSKAFKNALCQAGPPVPHYYLNREAARRCIRHADHKGPHRNRFFEWDDEKANSRGDTTDIRQRKDYKTMEHIKSILKEKV